MLSLAERTGSMLLTALMLVACAERGDDGDDDDRPGGRSEEYVIPTTPEPDSVHYDDIVELLVRNQTTRTVYRLYISPSESESWGPDVLGDDVLPVAGTVSFETERCDAYYDLKAVDTFGATIARANHLYFECGKRETITLR